MVLRENHVLIDAGEHDQGPAILSHLRGVPDLDIVAERPVGQVLYNGFDYDSATFNDFWELIGSERLLCLLAPQDGRRPREELHENHQDRYHPRGRTHEAEHYEWPPVWRKALSMGADVHPPGSHR